MDRRDIQEILFSSIKEDDPYRASKLLQIERWCYANWHLHSGYGVIRNNFLAQVLSDEDCWNEVNTLHRVKLDRQKVGKKLIAPGSDGNPNPFGTDRYRIACECCLEQDVVKMFSSYMQERDVTNGNLLRELVSNLSYGNPLKAFWSHVVGNYALSNNFNCTVNFEQGEAVRSFWDKAKSGDYSKLNLKGRHLYEYGLDCAVGWKQVQAVGFFWDKIEALPECEMSREKKDEILMRNAVYTAGVNFRVYPDIFEFFFDQFQRLFKEKELKEKYSELLEGDFKKNGYYSSLDRMRDMLSFDKFQKLFDCLKPSDISEDCYHTHLYFMKIQNYSERYIDEAKKLFMHIWKKEGFDIHRDFVIEEEVMDSSSYIHKKLLVRWVEKRCLEPLWAVLDKLDSSQRKEYMTHEQAEHIRGILAGWKDSASLDRFLSYGQSADEELCQKPDPRDDALLDRLLAFGQSADEELCQKPDPSGDLTEAKVEKHIASLGLNK